MVHYVDVGKYAGLTPHDLAPQWHPHFSWITMFLEPLVFGTPTAGYYGPNNEPINIGYRRWRGPWGYPLEFLLLVQEHLNPCTIQDVIDLGIGTSSGGLIIQGLFIMSWTVPECSRTFESLAHRIFSQRRNSAALNLIRPFITGRSLVSESARWLSWLLRDSCYDARVFDDVLKETFGEYRRMFGPSRDDPREQSYSSTKAGVVATGISRDTSTFVFANFNPTSRNEAGHRIIRPSDTARDPTVWKAFFTPADLQGIGSFQDGGLKHNFAGAIALEVSHQIWPNAGGRSIFETFFGTAFTPRVRRVDVNYGH
ncbi:Patatin-like serine hydrolase [Penicillium chermesinum]|nr:Patatin-like serine hydrolase [Penicillium chermesinum]